MACELAHTANISTKIITRTTQNNGNENKKGARETGRETGRERRDAAQFIRPDSKMYSKVAAMMRLFRVQLSLDSPYLKQ